MYTADNNVTVTPVVAGTLGMGTKNLQMSLKQIGVTVRTEWALCRIQSHGTQNTLLDGKRRSGTLKRKVISLLDCKQSLRMVARAENRTSERARARAKTKLASR